MTKIAIDVVLLPDEKMTDKAIEINQELIKDNTPRIILNKQNCLPHISLLMGCVEKEDLAKIELILKEIADKLKSFHFTATKISIYDTPGWEKSADFTVEKTEGLQNLHEMVLKKIMPLMDHNPTKGMTFAPEETEEQTLDWIKNYPVKASNENFYPHITLGFGEPKDISLPIEFSASKLAICHLGNCCTCRKLLISIDLKE